MKKIILCIVVLLLSGRIQAQDFSNKGRDFWLCFPSHVPTDITTLARMGLFITSDRNSSGTISVGTWSTTFTVTANQVTGPIDIPYFGASLTISASGVFAAKGIHVKVDNGQAPVVLYAHIYADARSEAALILPTNVLGRKYYAMSYYQDFLSVSKGGRSQFNVVATEPNTTIRYQLRVGGVLSPAAQTVLLPNAGDVLQIQNAADLTGTLIESVATATAPCKRIAVFSGSSGVGIHRNGCFAPTNSSMDPLFQQCYPTSTWGRSYGVMPLAGSPNGFHARVMAQEDNTQVNFDGVNVTLNAGEFYPASTDDAFPYTNAFAVTASKPVCVAEYMMSLFCATGQIVGVNGDPDMVILNPTEQNIADISMFSSNLENISRKYISVYIKTNAAASFRINGAVPAAVFTPINPANGYAYLTQELPLSGSSFRLTADSGFNAIAYGLGYAESYAYAAGTFVKNRYQYLATNNNGYLTDRALSCVGTSFSLYSIFPYQPSQITWDFNGVFPAQTVANPVHDSTISIDGRTLYRYRIPNPLTATAAGFYSIRVVSVNTTSAEGCTGQQEADYELEIRPAPVADFSFSAENCQPQKIQFTGSLDSVSRPAQHWAWQLGDGNTTAVANPLHTYGAPGSYTAQLYAISAIGCRSNAVSKPVTILPGLAASFTWPATRCASQQILFTNTSVVPPNTTVQEVKWDFGDGTAPVVLPGNPTHTYASAGTYNVVLTVAAASNCADTFRRSITVHPLPVLSFTNPRICVPDGKTVFTATANISTGNYNWYFSNGGQVLNSATAAYTFPSAGTYGVKLVGTSAEGCIDSTEQNLTAEAAPVAAFTPSAVELFSGSPLTVLNNSTPVAAIRNFIWQWGDGNTQTVTTNNSVSYTYNAFTATTYLIRLTATGLNGCTATDTARILIKPPSELPLPVVPNTFSPNGDGVNDTWVITGMAFYSRYRIQVYDRYGRLVFTTSSLTQPWNGTHQGKPLPAGVYYYTIELQSVGKPLSGSVLIVR